MNKDKDNKNFNEFLYECSYIDITDEEVIDMQEELDKKKKEKIKENVLLKMKEERAEQKNDIKKSLINTKYKGLKLAVIFIAIIAIIPTGSYAMSKLNVFEYFFNNTKSEKRYVAEAEKNTDKKQYQDENDVLKVKANRFVYSKDTNSGILQFTIINKTKDNRKLFEEVKVNSFYKDWKMGVRNMTEIVTIADSENYQLYFDVKGLKFMDNRIYLDKTKSTKNKKVCTMIFNDFEKNDFGKANLKLDIYDSNDDFDTPILSVDIPKAKSIPSYVWKDKYGNDRLLLTSMDYLLKDPPKSSVDKETGEVILSEISINFKNNDKYVVYSDRRKINNVFYATMGDNGNWYAFVNAIDLKEIESFTVDGKTFYTKDAIKNW